MLETTMPGPAGGKKPPGGTLEVPAKLLPRRRTPDAK